MGITKTRDGRYLVGQGVTDGNEYKGSLAWRDIVIQLSADGATAESVEKLEFLRDYGLYHSGEGNSVMPPSVSVWISNNGTTTAVEADDITVDGSNYTICGIKWNGSAWDFSQAGQGGGGGGLPPYTSADKGKVLTVGEGSESVEPKWEGNNIMALPSQMSTTFLATVSTLIQTAIVAADYVPRIGSSATLVFQDEDEYYYVQDFIHRCVTRGFGYLQWSDFLANVCLIDPTIDDERIWFTIPNFVQGTYNFLMSVGLHLSLSDNKYYEVKIVIQQMMPV